ncbi:MAG: type II TA system antitoxin MqsA family protein [Pseudomonadota bacterium]
MKQICPNCEKITDVQHIKTDEEITVKGERINVPVEYYKCLECGADFDDPKSKHDPLAIAYKEYRRRHGMMQPKEIRELRHRYGLTQKEFCKLLGWGEVTLSRYENGALQDDTHNTILQMIKDPRNLLGLIELQGDFLAEEKKNKLIGLLENAVKETHSFPSIYSEHFGKYGPDILSGFKELNLNKLFQAIIFFCVDGVLKTKLCKLLFYADFKHYRNNASSITGVRYVHLKLGPVPDRYGYYFATLENEEKAISVDEVNYGEYTGEMYHADIKPDLSAFSNSEIKTMIEVKEYFKDFGAREIKDFSHKERGYKETYDGQNISYAYAEDLQI